MRRFPRRRIVAPLALAALLLAAGQAWAVTLVNRDDSGYQWAVYWQDLSGIDRGDIGPRGKVELPKDAQGLLELVGKFDNIYVKPGETIVIIDGVMRKMP